MSSPEAVLELTGNGRRIMRSKYRLIRAKPSPMPVSNSMHSVELAFFLEDKLGIPVDETVIWDKATFAALAQHLAEQSGGGKQDGVKSSASDDRPIADVGDW